MFLIYLKSVLGAQGALPRPQPPPVERMMVRMTGSTPVHIESRPSMLSSHRIALQQHSGARSRLARCTSGKGHALT